VELKKEKENENENAGGNGEEKENVKENAVGNGEEDEKENAKENAVGNGEEDEKENDEGNATEAGTKDSLSLNKHASLTAERQQRRPRKLPELLDPAELSEHLDKRFEYETREMKQYTSWKDQRQHKKNMQKENRNEKIQQKANAEDGEKKTVSATVEVNNSVISVKIEDRYGKPRVLLYNALTKKVVTILHEFCQNALDSKPSYKFVNREELSRENVDHYFCSVFIDDKVYASAGAMNKKKAKNDAALKTMDLLAPGFEKKYEAASKTSNDSLALLEIRDPQIAMLSLSTGGYLPDRLLHECINRNKGVLDAANNLQFNITKNNHIHYVRTYGKHQVEGKAKSKRFARQESAQELLALLHPEMKTWGEVITKYGTSVTSKEATRRSDEAEIYDLKQRDRADRIAENNSQSMIKTKQYYNEQTKKGLMVNMLEGRMRVMGVEWKKNLEDKKKNSGPLCARCEASLNPDEDEDELPTKIRLLDGVDL